MMASDESICIPADDESISYESCRTGIRHRIPIVYAEIRIRVWEMVKKNPFYSNDNTPDITPLANVIECNSI
jgi:hypothetical protein